MYSPLANRSFTFHEPSRLPPLIARIPSNSANFDRPLLQINIYSGGQLLNFHIQCVLSKDRLGSLRDEVSTDTQQETFGIRDVTSEIVST